MYHPGEEERACLSRLLPQMLRLADNPAAQLVWLGDLAAIEQHMLRRWSERYTG
jgi:hypothetical protein